MTPRGSVAFALAASLVITACAGGRDSDETRRCSTLSECRRAAEDVLGRTPLLPDATARRGVTFTGGRVFERSDLLGPHLELEFAVDDRVPARLLVRVDRRDGARYRSPSDGELTVNGQAITVRRNPSGQPLAVLTESGALTYAVLGLPRTGVPPQPLEPQSALDRAVQLLAHLGSRST